MAVLARQFVGFDPQLADEVADHLNARAATIDAAPGRDELAEGSRPPLSDARRADPARTDGPNCPTEYRGGSSDRPIPAT